MPLRTIFYRLIFAALDPNAFGFDASKYFPTWTSMIFMVILLYLLLSFLYYVFMLPYRNALRVYVAAHIALYALTLSLSVLVTLRSIPRFLVFEAMFPGKTRLVLSTIAATTWTDFVSFLLTWALFMLLARFFNFGNIRAMKFYPLPIRPRMNQGREELQ